MKLIVLLFLLSGAYGLRIAQRPVMAFRPGAFTRQPLTTTAPNIPIPYLPFPHPLMLFLPTIVLAEPMLKFGVERNAKGTLAAEAKGSWAATRGLRCRAEEAKQRDAPLAQG